MTHYFHHSVIIISYSTAVGEDWQTVFLSEWNGAFTRSITCVCVSSWDPAPYRAQGIFLPFWVWLLWFPNVTALTPDSTIDLYWILRSEMITAGFSEVQWYPNIWKPSSLLACGGTPLIKTLVYYIMDGYRHYVMGFQCSLSQQIFVFCNAVFACESLFPLCLYYICTVMICTLFCVCVGINGGFENG